MQEETAYICRFPSPLGPITLSSDGEAVTGLWFAGQKRFGAALPERQLQENLPVLEQAKQWLTEFFDGSQPLPAPPLRPKGSAFQKAVWDQLLTIPYGGTVTYGALAARLGSSARAVGNAVARNPISLMIPCHRVVGAGGSLTGYAGGLDRKQWLLDLERQDHQR